MWSGSDHHGPASRVGPPTCPSLLAPVRTHSRPLPLLSSLARLSDAATTYAACPRCCRSPAVVYATGWRRRWLQCRPLPLSLSLPAVAIDDAE